jgi:hypothetical protein
MARKSEIAGILSYGLPFVSLARSPVDSNVVGSWKRDYYLLYTRKKSKLFCLLEETGEETQY